VVVARAQKLKGADLLPEIAVRLPPRTRLHLVGYQTEGLAKRLTETRRTPSGGSIIGHGEYAPSLVRGFIKNADVVLVPSVVETFSMVAAEAVALGRPVAAWDHIGATEAAPACFHTAPAWDFQALADAVGCAYATPMAADPSPWEQAAARMRLSFSAGATAASQDIRRRRQGLVSAMCDALPRPDPLHPASPVTSRHRRLFRKLVASPRTFLCDSAPAKAAARLIAAPRT
jgi:glycosyltransferase involved in cell wall biosynthesis